MVYLFLTPLQQNSGHYIPFPQPENLKSRVPFFFEKLATLLFSGLPLLGPSTAKLRPLHPIPTAWKPQNFSVVYLFLAPLQQNSGHYIPFPQPENLKSRVPFFPKNWQLYFSVVYLFLTPLQQNSGHYIPYITCFFPQPEKPKSRVPFFSEKLATLLCSLLPCYFCSSRPSTARPPPVHSPSTARPPDPDIRSRSSVSSLLPCYFCSSRPSTARPPPVHSPSTGSGHSLSLLRL